jgi:acyl carrier protein
MMNDELTLLIAQLFKVSPSEITDESSPKIIPQWDSLMTMKLFVEIEETFNATFTTEEMMNVKCVGDIRKILRQKQS